MKHKKCIFLKSMAIFEKGFDQQLTAIDDTHEINCIIETAQEVNGHTVGKMTHNVNRCLIKGKIWYKCILLLVGGCWRFCHK